MDVILPSPNILRCSVTVPIPINFRESEIGAVQVTIDQKKIKTWTVMMLFSSYGYGFRVLKFVQAFPNL